MVVEAMQRSGDRGPMMTSDADAMAQPPRSAGPLSDLTVIDLTAALAGPYATLLLAGLGARVIKVERPDRGDPVRSSPPYLSGHGVHLDRRGSDGMSVGFMNRARNKLGITLDLKSPAAIDIFHDLVRQSDVVMENFSRGTADRLGVGYGAAREANPRIVYCSLSGFGAEGNPGQGKAYDAIIQALSGVMMTSGNPGDPPVKVGFPLADLSAPLFAVIGILSALHRARLTGTGEHVDVSMLGALTSLVACEPFGTLERCGVPTRTGNSVPRLAPFGIFPAQDGWVAICASDNHMFGALTDVMGVPELADDVRYGDRNARAMHYQELDERISAWSAEMTSSDIVGQLTARNVPVAPVRTPQEAVADPDVRRRGEAVALSHPSLGDRENISGPGIPIRFSESQVGFDRPAPLLGQHNDIIYRGLLGYDSAQLEILREKGVI